MIDLTSLDFDGVLRISGGVCMLRVGGRVRLILEQSYCTKYFIYLRVDKIYHNLKKHY